jgi:phosphoglycolate phosphatase
VRPTVYLFDIDGTLIDTGGAGRRAITRAFARAHGRGDACGYLRFGGMTDRAIVRAGLSAIGAPVDAAAIDRVLDVYLEMLREEILEAKDVVLRGVEAAVERALAVSEGAVGLGTGNIREGARIKLAHAGMHHCFSFGGYGCDHETRSELLRIGAERGAEKLGASLEACRVVVIGDTPKDIAAARAIGAECVAVATGSYGVAELVEHGPSCVAHDLTDPVAASALFGE